MQVCVLRSNFFAGVPVKPVESDPHRLCQRQKQIDYGKNTLGYERYTEMVPRYELFLNRLERKQANKQEDFENFS